MVGQGGEERAQEVPVGGVEEEHVEAGGGRPAGGGGVGLPGGDQGAGVHPLRAAAAGRVGQGGGGGQPPASGGERPVEAPVTGERRPPAPAVGEAHGQPDAVAGAGPGAPHDPRPRLGLPVVPQPGGAGGDPPFGGRRHRLGDHQPRPRGGGGLQGGGVVVTGSPVHRRVGRRRGEYDPIGQPAGGGEAQRHQGGGRDEDPPGGGAGKDRLGPVDQGRVAGGQVVVADPAPGQEVEGELLGAEAEVAPHRLEVARRIGGHLLEALDDGLALPLVGGQGALEFGGMLDEGLGQGDGVVHGQTGARANGEVGGVGGVAHQDDVAVVPAPVVHGHKRAPGGSVRHEAVLTQVLGEELLAEGQALRLGHHIEAGPAPGRLGALDDEGGAVGVVGIGVHLEEPVPGGSEDEGEDGQGQVGAVPDVLAGGGREGGAKSLLGPCSHH